MRKILITGATRGIGRAIAEVLSDEWHIIVGGTNAESVAKVVSELPNASGFVADLGDDAAIERAVAEIDSLDALVHNAGIAISKNTDQATRDEWRQQFEINVFAVAQLTSLLLPKLREAKGQVVFINSGAGFNAYRGGNPYAASKFALLAMADALREEERGKVRVTSVHPGRVDTDMQVELQTEMGRAYDASQHLRAESIARAVKLALDTSEEGMVESISLRPVAR